MEIQLIPAILARGYGVSFRSLKFQPGDDDHANMVFPEKQERGDLLFGYDDETGIVIPMIRIGNEVSVCIAFTVYVPDVGWRSIDMSALPGTLDELQKASSGDTMALKMMEPVRDMSGYEIVHGWEEKA